MDNTLDPGNISHLCATVEKAVGYPLLTPKDFNRLSDDIFLRLQEMVSPSTLMRLWGYIKSDVQPRVYTLNLLSRYAGFRDWDDFCRTDGEGRQSGVVLYRHLNVASDLKRGQRVRLRWLPDRVCDVRYLGDMQFIVEHSVNTGLKEDTTFECLLIIEGEPLYLDNVRHPEIPASAYVCGKQNGVSFELEPPAFPGMR